MKTSGRTDRNGGADDSRDDLPDLGMGPPMRNGSGVTALRFDKAAMQRRD
jgi:hypothetical protein